MVPLPNLLDMLPSKNNPLVPCVCLYTWTIYLPEKAPSTGPADSVYNTTTGIILAAAMYERILSLILIEWENLKINERISLCFQNNFISTWFTFFIQCNKELLHYSLRVACKYFFSTDIFLNSIKGRESLIVLLFFFGVKKMKLLISRSGYIPLIEPRTIMFIS